ncbi:MAG: nucleotidyltransferase [Cyclobacteriaceae bacterium]|nr:nucleotidyltransferase [Cyclobacteriaceae bacterium]
MARTIDEIQQSIITEVQADTTLAPVATSTSKTALWRLWTRVVAIAAWTVEVLFDTLKAEVNELLAVLKPHTLKWYATKAKAFQYGYSLPDDTDLYDNTGLTETQISDSQIVKYVAVVEQTKNLRLKVAKLATDLAPLSAPELTAFREYMARVKDAGVKLIIDSNVADKLKLNIEIYYDPLILNDAGQRIDGSDLQPVQNAINKYLQNLPFNGVFVLAYLVDELQKVDGVVIPNITQALSSYGLFSFTSINVKYQPDSGYLRFENPTDLVITWIAQSPLQ